MSPAGSAWTRRQVAAAVAAAIVTLLAFGARFLPLGGTLGGFDNDHFVHLLRSDMVLNGERPLRDFADAELRGAWPSLGYAASAWAQQIGGRTLLPEGYLTAGGLALAAGGVFLLALQLSRRWLVAVLAAALVIVSHPKLYNYEKAVVLFGALLVVSLWTARPSWPRLAAISAWTAAAALVRHDFGVYAGLAAVAALVAMPGPLTTRLVRVAGYVALTVVLLLPSILWVQRYAGLIPYAQRTLESARSESLRTELERPVFDPAAGFEEENVTAIVYYLFWAVPAAGLGVLGLLVLRRPFPGAVVATGFAVLLCAFAVNQFFLRGNLMARFGDAAVPVALAGAWAAGAGGRTFVRAVPIALLLALAATLWVGGDMRGEVRAVTSRIDSWDDFEEHVGRVHAGLSSMPPHAWSDETATGTLTAARYLAECTDPSDRVLLATYAPEVPVFARRLFAAGQGTFGLAFYESEMQQREAVARLERQSVPVVLGSYEHFEGEFADDYRLVNAHVEKHYRDAGSIPVNGRPWFRVLVAADREPRGVHPAYNLPCFR